MSERVYSGKLRIPEPRKRRRASWVPWRGLLLLVLLGVGGSVAWLTRDTQSLAALVPAQQKYNVILVDILENRSRIASSDIWESLPESVGVAELPQRLSQDLGIPSWVLNNLIGRESYLTGNDVTQFSDALYLTRMSWIGSLILRGGRLLPGVEGDYAGGLKLSKLTEAGLFFAARGRVLLVTPSRDALIRALALPQDGGLAETELAQRLSETGAEDLRGTVTLEADDPLGEAFQHLSFALRIEPSEMQLSCRGILRPVWQERIGQLVADAGPQPLVAPPDGLVMVSANFGKSLREVWHGVSAVSQMPELKHMWEKWEQAPIDEAPSLAYLATAFLGPMGPGIRVTWRGVDLNEMAPTPELVATVDTEGQELETVFASLPAVPYGMSAWESFPRYDEESGRVHVPMLGGPSLEPTFGRYGDALLLSTSRTVAEELLEQGPEDGEATLQNGNLYIRIRPFQCVEAIADVGRLLAENHLLRGHTQESFEELANRWLASAGRIEEVTAVARVESGGVSMESRLLTSGNL